MFRPGNDSARTVDFAGRGRGPGLGPGDGANSVEATLILLTDGGLGLPIDWPIHDLLADGDVRPSDWQRRLTLTEGECNTDSAATGPERNSSAPSECRPPSQI